jgi:hypothetical protein
LNEATEIDMIFFNPLFLILFNCDGLLYVSMFGMHSRYYIEWVFNSNAIHPQPKVWGLLAMPQIKICADNLKGISTEEQTGRSDAYKNKRTSFD